VFPSEICPNTYILPSLSFLYPFSFRAQSRSPHPHFLNLTVPASKTVFSSQRSPSPPPQKHTPPPHPPKFPSLSFLLLEKDSALTNHPRLKSSLFCVKPLGFLIPPPSSREKKIRPPSALSSKFGQWKKGFLFPFSSHQFHAPL